MINKIKRRLLRRKSGGFTLAEVIISCALLGILMIGIISFMSPILEMVGDTNASTRASNASESIEYYISRSIRNAAYISVLTDTSFDDVQSSASEILTGLRGIANQPEYKDYTMKCISIRYAMDERSLTNKYFICTETVESTGLLKANNPPSRDSMVFDPCYFDGIYPKITLTQVQQEQDDGTFKDMPAVKIDVEVYDDALMRKSAPPANDLIFSGTGYTVLRTIELAQKSNDLKFNIVESFPIADTLGHLPKSINPGDNTMKETYIFYLERSLATTPTTPAP